MHKKLLLSMIAVFMCLLLATPVSASEKSIVKLNQQEQIVNNGDSIIVDYDGAQARVVYGNNGIDIITDDEIVHLDTPFSVLRLIELGDINSDGITDFFCYLNANEFTDQLYAISGKDGSIISSTRLTRDSQDEALGNITINCHILKLDNIGYKAYVICNYDIVCINTVNGEILGSYSNKDNIWDFVIDGETIYFIDQLGYLYSINASTMEYINSIKLANSYQLHLSWDEGNIFDAQMNLWDIKMIDGSLFITAEDGYLYMVDPMSFASEGYELGAIDIDFFKSVMSDQLEWGMSIHYQPTGITLTRFKSYKIIDYSDSHILISCQFLDKDTVANDGYNQLPKSIILFDRNEKAVSAVITGVSDEKGVDAVLAQYQGNGVVTLFSKADEKSLNVTMFDYQGNTVYSKNTIVGLDSSNGINVSFDGESYLIEAYKNGCGKLSADLEKIEYLYSNITSSLLDLNDTNCIVVQKNNGIGNKVICYNNDLTNIKWEYELKLKERNHGFEFVECADYDHDGIKDVVTIVNYYNKKDVAKYSYFIIISGANGKVLVNKKISLGTQYDSNGKPYTAFLLADELSLVKDLDGDKKSELLINDNVISSKTFTIKGYANTYVDAQGKKLEIGDVNKDSIPDYIYVTNKAATLYSSYIKGYNIDYTKTKKTVELDKKLSNEIFADVLGDINNDGVNEIVLNGSKNNLQVFNIYNGKTLAKMYTICPNGVSDYEMYWVLDEDLNSDGYNEIMGFTGRGYMYVLIDGKSGEEIKYFTIYEKEDREPDVNYYHPDYIIGLADSSYERNVSATSYSDLNNDGKVDIAVIKHYYDEETWTMKTGLFVYDQQTMELLDIVDITSSEEMYENVRLMKVENDDNHYVITDESKTRLYNSKDNRIVATYDLGGEKFIGTDNKLIVSTKDNDLYLLNLDSTFEITSTIPEMINKNEIDLKWNTYIDGSVMQIFDNGNLVYKGCDDNCTIKLLAGEHTIVLSSSDNYGKSSNEVVKVTVAPQANHYVWMLAVVGVAFILAVILNMNRKLKVKRKIKEGLK